MILKTALNVDNHPGADLPNAWIAYAHRDFFTFVCNCGEYFKLRSTNSFTSYEDIQCPDCKRIGRLKENIGERYIFKRVKWDAKKAGRSFNLSFDWFVKAIHQPCHYCNRVDINKVNVASKKAGEFLLTDFRYNGLDRVDNSIGYEESNCVPCCVVCNRAKNSMPYDDFMEYVAALVNYQSSIGDSNVNYDHAVHSARIPYRGRHRKTGNDSPYEELSDHEISISYDDGHRLYMDSRGNAEWARGFSGSPYRTFERTIQA